MEAEVKSDHTKGSDPQGSPGPTLEELSSLREHEPLQELLSQIPRKAQKGMLIQCDLILTCIDANEDYIILGTNVGMVFLFDQKKRSVERKLRTESNNDTISVVRLHKGFDSQVAVGTNGGIIYIFQLPSYLPGQNKQLQQFVVQNLHHSSITCVAWSLNGMKLFSGDKKGLVVCTEVDFYERQCSSSVTLHENDSEIIQLHHAHKSLLISTLHRSLVYRPHLTSDKVTQIGKKDRKILGKFGACFIPGLCKPEDAQLYASRPGLRVWKAAITGVVLNTNLFKDLLAQTHRDIPIIPFDGQTRTQLKSSDQQFEALLLYKEMYLVTWTTSHLYLLKPDTNTVVASQARLGVIIDVTVTQDDIFVLRQNTSRNVIRLGLKPLAKQESMYERLVRERQLASDAVRSKHLRQGGPETTTADSEVKPRADKPSKSPLKFLQENVFDKLKVLDKVTGSGAGNSVSHLVSSMDRFGSKDDDNGEEISHEIDRTEIASLSDVRTHDRDSPSKALPPVVQLDSQDLLTIEIFSGIPPTSLSLSDATDKPFTYNSSPCSGRFNPFLRDPISDTEAEELCTDTFDKESLRNKAERSSTPKCVIVPDMTETSDDVSQSCPEEPTSPQPKFMIEKLDKVLKNDAPTDNIVFTHKQKKGKKKNKTNKDREDKTESQKIATPTKPVITTEDDPDRKEEEESPTTVTLDNEPEVTLREPLDMEEPENSQKFEEMSKELELFEKKLSDLPHSSVVDDESEDVSSSGPVEPDIDDTERDIGTSVRTDMCSGTTDLHTTEQTVTEVVPVIASSQNVTGPGSVPGESNDSSVVVERVEKSELYLGEDSYESRAESDLKHVPLEQNPLASVDLGEEEESIYSKKDGVSSESAIKDTMDDLLKNTDKYFPAYKTSDSSVEDFYGKSGGSMSSPESESAERSKKMSRNPEIKDDKQEFVMSSHDRSCSSVSQSLINNWMETSVAGNVYSMAISNSHVWVVDKSCNVYYTSLQGGRLKWQRLKDYGHQIAVSRSGFIVWRLYKETVYAGTKITSRHPEGMKWVEAVRDVQFVAVDNNCAWYMKTSGHVMIQTGLSKERPCFKSRSVPGDPSLHFRQIVCQDGVVWAITEEYRLMYRHGISQQCPEGKAWQPNNHVGEEALFSHVALGSGEVGWGVDVLGRIRFITGVTMDTPMGQECWWQVPVSEILVQDMTALDTLRSLTRKFDPQKLAHLLSTQRGGLIVAGEGGVWTCPEYKNTLQVCRGSMEGHSWREVNLSGFTSSIAWKLLSASVSSYKNGLVWCVQPNGDVFTLCPSTGQTKSIESPSPRHRLVRLSCCPNAVWGLTDSGYVYIRGGVKRECPQGTEWTRLDLLQLGDVHLVSVSCGHVNVWAVDSDSVVYQRIGVKAPSSHSLIQAWLPVDYGATGTTFTQVISGPRDWIVWAIDNRRQVYTRTGITDSMPIGTDWVHVPGTQAQQITMSERNVWALNTAGEILCRYGVTPDNPTGNYWRKVPGVFIHISTSPLDDIWAINHDGHIYRRRTRYLHHKHTDDDTLLLDQSMRRGASMSSDDGWELV